jgi:alpha-galactosidase/6-phospho-beta-glucosidase family protein
MQKRQSLRHASSWPVLPHVTFQDEAEEIPKQSTSLDSETMSVSFSHETVDMTDTYQPPSDSPSTLYEGTSAEDDIEWKQQPDSELVSAALEQAKHDGYSEEYAKHIAESARIVNSMWDDKRTRFNSNVTTNGSVLSALIHLEESQKRGKFRRRQGAKKVSLK